MVQVRLGNRGEDEVGEEVLAEGSDVRVEFVGDMRSVGEGF